MQFIQTDHLNKRYLTSDGQEITFHGLNIVYKRAPYYPYIQDKRDGIESLTDEDIQWIQDNGFNFIRLGVQMMGVMPEYDYVNQTYLNEMMKIVNRLGQKGIYTLIEMHQDLISNYTCGEGVSDYAVPQSRSDIAGFPMPFTEPYEPDENGIPTPQQCASFSWGKYYFTDMVAFYFKCLYEGNCSAFEEGSGKEHIILQDEVKKYWGNVSSFFKDNEYVIGYEVLNEPNIIAPQVLDDDYSYLIPQKFEKEFLEPFYLEIIPVIYQNDQNHIIHFEPCADNWFPTGMDDIVEQLEQKGIPKDKLAWAYHVYCSTNSEGDPTKRLCTVEENLQYFFKVRSGVTSLNLTSFANEFGAFQESDVSHKTLIDQIGIFEMFNQPWAYWNFKCMTDSREPYDPEDNGSQESLFYFNGSEQTEKVRLLSHPYMNITDGRILHQTFEQYGQTFTISMITGKKDGKSIITLGNHWKNFGSNYIVRKGKENQDFSIVFDYDSITITNNVEGAIIEIVIW